MAYNPGLAERHKQVHHTVLERNPEEAAAPTEVAHKEVVEVVQAVHMAVEVVAPLAVHKGIEVARKEVAEVVHMAVEVVHRDIEAVAQNLAAEAGLDHKTSIIPSCQICISFLLKHSR